METDQGDGAHSPPIWLVTPLISKLPAIVLGRVLKNAGYRSWEGAVVESGEEPGEEKDNTTDKVCVCGECVCVCVCVCVRACV